MNTALTIEKQKLVN